MKILVYPHDLSIGGSQLNAVEIAAAVQERGHSIAIIGSPGQLETRIAELGIEFIELPPPGRRPSPRTVREIRRLISERKIDAIHGYEWPPSLEALMACHGSRATAVSTVLSMSVAPFLPKGLPLMVGTEQIAEAERSFGRSTVALMEPPVDTRLNSPQIELPVEQFVTDWGLRRDYRTIVIVSRLAHEMKLEGILSAMSAVAEVSGTTRAQLLIAGAGPAEPEVRLRANAVNQSVGERRVVLTGELQDPRCAYAVADVVLGMGGSALRGMAFGKPLIVQGEEGFWKTLKPDTLHEFLWQGWYGVGSGAAHGVSQLRSELEPLLRDGARRTELGNFALATLRSRFSLDAAATNQIDFYENAIRRATTTGDKWGENLASAARFGAYKTSRLISRWRGRATADDFNAQPILRHSKDDLRNEVKP